MELDNVHEELGMIIQCNNGIIAKLKEENEQLKEENEGLRFIIEKYENANERLYDAKVDDFNFTLTKYRSALEEIREIILQAKVTNNKKLGTILTKLNEVLKDQ